MMAVLPILTPTSRGCVTGLLYLFSKCCCRDVDVQFRLQQLEAMTYLDGPPLTVLVELLESCFQNKVCDGPWTHVRGHLDGDQNSLQESTKLRNLRSPDSLEAAEVPAT